MAAFDAIPDDPRVSNGARTLAIDGEVDAANAAILEGRLREFSFEGDGDVVVDCTNLRFIDSTGLRTLCAVHAELAEHERSLQLANCPPHLLRLLDLTGLTSMFVTVGAHERGAARR